jgi:hypothetical protein
MLSARLPKLLVGFYGRVGYKVANLSYVRRTW